VVPPGGSSKGPPSVARKWCAICWVPQRGSPSGFRHVVSQGVTPRGSANVPIGVISGGLSWTVFRGRASWLGSPGGDPLASVLC
jgi:hypothetical protein